MSDYRWKPFCGDCPLCGGAAEVFTTITEPGIAYDGDKARCSDTECGHEGVIVVTDDPSSLDESVAHAYVQWDDDL